MKRFVVTENFGELEFWRSQNMSQEEAYVHADQLRKDPNRGEVRILEYLPINNHILN
jgi:hypothetical protein